MLSFDLVLGLLAAVVVLAAIGRRFTLPNPIVFALGGILLALVPNVPEVALSPSLVLVVFLPPLIYAAAQDTSWAEVREHARPILLLAVGLVLVTMAAVAAVVHALVPGMSWAAALALGAIVGPPDAVAMKAIADTLHLPRRLVAVLEGEGLFNDATALVAFQIASAAAVGAGPESRFDAGHSTFQFAYSAGIAILIGIVISWVGLRVIRRLGEPVTENTVLLLLPFATYLLAEEVHASGVLAVLVLALQINQVGTRSVSPRARLISRVLWEMIDFLLTGLSFVLVGLQLRSVLAGLSPYPTLQIVSVSIAVCLTVILIRPLWVFSVTGVLRLLHLGLKKGEGPSAVPYPSLLVVSWAGMRGVVSLAVALSLPHTLTNGQPFVERDLIVFVTFVVILVTLVGQGLTLPALIRRLGILSNKEESAHQELAARLRVVHAALAQLDEIAHEGQYPDAVVNHLREHYDEQVKRLEEQRDQMQTSADGQKIETQTEDPAPAIRELRTRLLKFEQQELQRLRDAGEIDSPLARKIQQEIDASKVRIRHFH